MRPFLPLPTGLIGDVGLAKPRYDEGRPFYPFLSYEQILIVLAIFAVGAVVVLVFASEDARMGIIIGGACGMAPSVLITAPYEIVVRTSRPLPWIDFTRNYLVASRYKRAANQPEDGEIWVSALSAWRVWRDAKLTIIATNDGLHVKGPRSLIGPLARNYKRIAAQGARSSQ